MYHAYKPLAGARYRSGLCVQTQLIDHEGYHVLVVDDDPSVLRILEHILSSRGYTVSTASTASMAMDIFEIQGADLVILDVRLPDMDGFEICQTIKRTNDVPVVILTAAKNKMVRESLPQLADGAGANVYLRKPIDADEVTSVVDSFVHS